MEESKTSNSHTIFPAFGKYLISKAHPTIYYIPEFINKDEEEYLLRQVYDAPKPRWKQLSNRRLQMWGGVPHEKGMLAEKLPKWLEDHAQRITGLGVFGDKAANHVLVNEYKPGEGIMPHEDGPLYFPTVSTISLGSHTLLDFYYHLDYSNHDNKPEQLCHGVNMQGSSLEDRHFGSLLLEPRSLVLVLDDMYKVHLHGIKENTSDEITERVMNLDSCKAELGQTLDRTTRVSLTIRHVPKTLKTKLFLGKR